MKVPSPLAGVRERGVPITSIIEVPGQADRSPIPLGVRVGDLIYSSNLLGQDLTTGHLPETLDEQFDLAFAHLRTLIERGGASVDNVAQVTFFLEHLPDRAGINRPWLDMFPDEHDRPTYKFMQAPLGGGHLVRLQTFAVAGQRRQVLNIPGIAHGNPIPMGVKIGSYLFTSRILPADPATGKNGEGPEAQAELALQNLETLVEMAGGKPSDVTQVWVFLKDPAHLQAVEVPWSRLFGSHGPARHPVTVDLPGNLLVMAECMALIP